MFVTVCLRIDRKMGSLKMILPITCYVWKLAGFCRITQKKILLTVAVIILTEV